MDGESCKQKDNVVLKIFMSSYYIEFIREVDPDSKTTAIILGYNRTIRWNGKLRSERLFTKKYVVNDGIEYRQVYNYGNPQNVDWGVDLVNEASSIDENGVSSFVDKKFEKSSSQLRSFFLESCQSRGANYLFDSLNIDRSFKKIFPELNEQGTRSAIFFKGCIGHRWHTIKIYKNIDGINVVYSHSRKERSSTMPCDYLLLPSISAGNITTEEIDMIIGELLCGFGDPTFNELVSMELAEFRKKICVNKGLIPQDDDILDPTRFLEMSDTSVEAELKEHRDDYFREALRQFRASTHLAARESMGDKKSFEMKPVSGTGH